MSQRVIFKQTDVVDLSRLYIVCRDMTQKRKEMGNRAVAPKALALSLALSVELGIEQNVILVGAVNEGILEYERQVLSHRLQPYGKSSISETRMGRRGFEALVYFRRDSDAVSFKLKHGDHYEIMPVVQVAAGGGEE